MIYIHKYIDVYIVIKQETKLQKHIALLNISSLRKSSCYYLYMCWVFNEKQKN